MQPPLKRPRLSMFSRDLAPDETLSQARWRNDLSLKSRFEAIFEKYAHDFTGIGDEIEVATGTVVVNNGHLEEMEDEGDIGITRPPLHTPPKQSKVINGGSFLRAMTAAPEDHGLSFEDVYDEDVVMSIEAMAENATGYSDDDDMESRAMEDPTGVGYDKVSPVILEAHMAGNGDYVEEEEAEEDNFSNEDLFQATDHIFEEHFDHEAPTHLGTRDADFATGWMSNLAHNGQSTDIDSNIVVKQEDDEHWPDESPLFDEPDHDRSSSPDSLFEVANDTEEFRNPDPEKESQRSAYPRRSSVGREVSNDAILDKFGPNIGPQVIDVLQKRRAMIDAHIEPAWRLPDVGFVFPKPKLATPPDELHFSPEPSSGRKESLWRDPQTSTSASEKRRHAKSRKARGASQLSNESEDPLQEDFCEPTDNAEDPNEVDDGNVEDLLDDVRDGICPFCRKQFSVTGSVYAHWDELIKKSARDDVHDMVYIRHERRRKRRRNRFPKVTVQDFRTMIQLREIDELDWQEIYEREIFGQRSVSSLQSIYYQYRTIGKTDEELAAEKRSWTAEEDARLLDFCKDPNITFLKLKKLMKTRPQAELGNRLASIWMQEDPDQVTEFGRSRIEASLGSRALGYRRPGSPETSLVRHGSSESDRLRRSLSSDSMDSLFQIEYDPGATSDHSDSDDGLFGAA